MSTQLGRELEPSPVRGYGGGMSGGRRAFGTLATLIVGAMAWTTFAWLGPVAASVNGAVVPLDQTPLERWAAFHAGRWAAEPVTIIVQVPSEERGVAEGEVLQEVVVSTTRARLGARLEPEDLQELVQEARLRRLSPSSWAQATERLPVVASWVPRVDADALYDFVDVVRPRVVIAPTPQMLGPDGRAIGGRVGRSLDRDAAVARLRDALLASEPVVRLDAAIVAPPEPIVQADSAARFGVTVAGRAVRYGGAESGRAHNIERVARELDGAVLPPGAVFSFNVLAGPRTLERGFVTGPEVVAGRLAEGVGGGICQVAAEIYHVSLESGLKVEEWHPHSRRVSYAALGFDAAVAWPSTDLRVRNVLPFHLRLRVSARQGRLQVAWEGAREGPSVEVSARTLRGARDRLSSPVEVEVTRLIRLGESTHEETWQVTYPPADEGE